MDSALDSTHSIIGITVLIEKIGSDPGASTISIPNSPENVEENGNVNRMVRSERGSKSFRKMTDVVRNEKPSLCSNKYHNQPGSGPEKTQDPIIV